jgi:hypothetical protein
MLIVLAEHRSAWNPATFSECCVWSAEMRQVVENNLLDGNDSIEKRPVRLPTIVAHARDLVLITTQSSVGN